MTRVRGMQGSRVDAVPEERTMTGAAFLGGTKLREVDRQSLCAPFTFVGFVAQKARMPVIVAKPVRFMRGVSGCMHRVHRGPLLAAWGARLLKLEKDRAWRAGAP